MPVTFDTARKCRYPEYLYLTEGGDLRDALEYLSGQSVLTDNPELHFNEVRNAFQTIFDYADAAAGKPTERQVTEEQAQEAWRYLADANNNRALEQEINNRMPAMRGQGSNLRIISSYRYILDVVPASENYIKLHERRLENYEPEEPQPAGFDPDALRPLTEGMAVDGGQTDFLRSITDPQGVPCTYWLGQMQNYLQNPPADPESLEGRMAYARAEEGWRNARSLIADKRAELEHRMETMQPDSREYRTALGQLNAVSAWDNAFAYAAENSEAAALETDYRETTASFPGLNGLIKHSRTVTSNYAANLDDSIMSIDDSDDAYDVEILNDSETECTYTHCRSFNASVRTALGSGVYEEQLAAYDKKIAALKKTMPAGKPAGLEGADTLKQMDEKCFEAKKKYIQQGKDVYGGYLTHGGSTVEAKALIENDMPNGKRYRAMDNYTKLRALELSRAVLVKSNLGQYTNDVKNRLDALSTARRDRLQNTLSAHLGKLAGMHRLVSDSEEYKGFRDALDAASKGGDLTALVSAADHYIGEKTKNNNTPSTDVGKSRLEIARAVRQLAAQELACRAKGGPAMRLPEQNVAQNALAQNAPAQNAPAQPVTEADLLIRKAEETLGADHVTDKLRANIRTMYAEAKAARESIAEKCADLEATVNCGPEAARILSYQALKNSINDGTFDAWKADFYGKDNTAEMCGRLTSAEAHLQYITGRPHPGRFYVERIMVDNSLNAEAAHVNEALDGLRARAAQAGENAPARRANSVHVSGARQAGEDQPAVENRPRGGSVKLPQ